MTPSPDRSSARAAPGASSERPADALRGDSPSVGQPDTSGQPGAHTRRDAPGQSGAPTRHPRPARRTRWVAIGIGAAAALLGYAGAGVPEYWGDEAASVMSAERDWPSLASMLGDVDLVHGLYYALLHLWIDVFGAGEWSTRALSSIAVGFLAAGVVVLGTAWFGPRVAVAGGILCAVLPRTTYLAVEARSYALAAAVAVWLTVAFVALLRDRRAAWWWGLYAVGLAAAIVLFLHVGMLLIVHAVALAAERPRPSRAVVRGFFVGAVAGVLLALPFVMAALGQRDQLGYLALREWARPEHVLVTQWFESPGVAVLAWLLMLAGVIGSVVGRRFGDAIPAGLWPVLAWVVLPTTALLVVDLTITKTYSPRYVAFCVPAVAMLMALGIERIARLAVIGVRRADASARASGSRTIDRGAPVVASVVTVLLVVACAVAAAPTYLGQRTASAKDGGAEFRTVAEYVREHAQPGDAVLFGLADRRSREPRLALRLYPDAFDGLVDAQLATPYDELPGLWDEVVPLGAVAGGLTAQTVWAIDATGSPLGGDEQRVTPTDPTIMADAGYRLAGTVEFERTMISRYVRAS